MALSIIIVSFNTKKYLRNCLDSLYRDNVNTEVIVVDNGSSDGSQNMVKSFFPQVKLIQNKKNFGFGKANNIGVANSCGEIIFFLNSDTIVPKGILKKIIKFFQKYPRAGVMAPLVKLPSGEIQPYSFGEDTSLFGLIRDKFLKAKFEAKTQKVDWVTGAALCCRRNVFNQISGFDENFFMYFEDNDLCVRARKLGFPVYLYSGAEIIHFGGKSIESSHLRSDVYFKSQEYFFKKHYGLIGLLLVKIFRAPYRIFKK